MLGTIGAALLAGAALVAESQQPPPPQPAPAATQASAAPATAVQHVSKSLGLVVYPANKQSASQQSVDEQECYNWAKAQTGIDPQAPPPAATAAEAPKQGGQRLKGAARGAAAGAVIGEVADNDADEGAKVGAAAGAIAGGRKARHEKQAHAEQTQNQAQAAQNERIATFRNAVGTCLQGRGYTTG
jgi:uncharacterized protein YcfJ